MILHCQGIGFRDFVSFHKFSQRWLIAVAYYRFMQNSSGVEVCL